MNQKDIQNQIIEKILEETFTRPQLIKRLRFLHGFISFKLFEVGSLSGPEANQLTLEHLIDNYMEKQPSDLRQKGVDEINWLKDLGEQFLSLFSPQNSTQIFKVLEEYASTIRPITIYLPFDMPEEERLRLGKWVKQNIGKTALFEINYDGNLIAGCALSYRGVYRDFSLKNKFDENKELIQQSIIQSLKGVRG